MVAAQIRQRDEPTTDDELLAAFLAARDEEAFERLVARHGPMVLRICRAVLGDHSEAEDAFQATFLHLFRRADSIRNHAAVKYWLCEVARRVAQRARQVRAKRRTREQAAATSGAPPIPDQEALDREWRPILHEEIRRLPTKLRDPIELCYFDGLTVEAAARRLDCPEGTLKSRLGKGRELLRERLARRGLATSAVLFLLFWITEPDEAASIVPESLIHATVAGAFGTSPAPMASVVAPAVADEPAEPEDAPRWRFWVILALGGFGGICLVLTLAAAAWTGLPPTVLVVRFLTELVRSIPFIGKHLCH